MPLPPGSTYGDIGNESRPSIFKIFELLIFLCFLIIWNQKTYFCVTIHSHIYHLYADVGPRWPEGFPRHRQRGRGDDIMGVDAEWMLQSIHTNFLRLTNRVPMAQVEDFPEAMQHQMERSKLTKFDLNYS